VSGPDGRNGPPRASHHRGQAPFPKTQILTSRVISSNQYTEQLPIREEHRLRERNFGDWEGKSWDAAYASDPDNFHGLIDKPDTYRPPGGETTTELQCRVVQWFEDFVAQDLGSASTVIAVTHSGPIAALVGHLLHLAPRDWSPWLLGYGEIVTITRPHSSGAAITVKKGW